ncbi:transcription repressor OFP13-like [Henckelia pumila]|uniref:transcription repressor OFP13-like n=1 Tax=Henckelia pumila TaxID=405737 RepID=UPI003C6E5477
MMSKKMKMIPSIFKTRDEAKHSYYNWQWPSCKHPKTLSFRAGRDVLDNNMMFKTVNSIYLDPAETPESWFTNTSESASFSTDGEFSDGGGEWLETIIRGVRLSERLFFEPGDTSSMVTKADDAKDVVVDDDDELGVVLPFKESVALALESSDPYMDFKKSMQEMVESQGLKDWDCLEELLGWYLKMNGKMNHRYIVGAFVDLLVGLASTSTTDQSSAAADLCCNSDSTSYSSAASSFSSSPRAIDGGDINVLQS